MGLGAVLGVGSVLLGASSSNKAASAQRAAAASQAEVARETRDLTRADLAPFLSSGVSAQNALAFEMGLGPRPTFGGNPAEITTRTIEGGGAPDFRIQINPGGGDDTQFQAFSGNQLLGSANNLRALDQFRPAAPASSTQYSVGDNTFTTLEEAQAFAAANPVGGQEYQGYTATPGYDFRLQQGLGAVDMSAAARGGLNSGATLKASQQFGRNLATEDYGNYLNRLTGMASNGQNAAGAQGASNQFYSQQAGNALAAGGNAAAAGAIGFNNALQGGISNYFGYMGQQNALNALGGRGQGLFSGNSWG